MGRPALEEGRQSQKSSGGADSDHKKTKTHRLCQILRLGDGNGSGTAGFVHGRSPTLFVTRTADCGGA